MMFSTSHIVERSSALDGLGQQGAGIVRRGTFPPDPRALEDGVLFEPADQRYWHRTQVPLGPRQHDAGLVVGIAFHDQDGTGRADDRDPPAASVQRIRGGGLGPSGGFAPSSTCTRSRSAPASSRPGRSVAPTPSSAVRNRESPGGHAVAVSGNGVPVDRRAATSRQSVDLPRPGSPSSTVELVEEVEPPGPHASGDRHPVLFRFTREHHRSARQRAKDLCRGPRVDGPALVDPDAGGPLDNPDRRRTAKALSQFFGRRHDEAMQLALDVRARVHCRAPSGKKCHQGCSFASDLGFGQLRPAERFPCGSDGVYRVRLGPAASRGAVGTVELNDSFCCREQDRARPAL